ncbi:hypothetical protein [uncultured Eubacterium sp.]|uniref:hypothetical protein n=1 Tax=uncultured Eubacterium sp. TaxID=165185 RepID=UPI0025CEC422|nr:hypothetical protein [uncultured Eubacterium sp.]
MIALQLAKIRGFLSEEELAAYIEELQTVPDKIEKIIDDKERIRILQHHWL